MYFSLKLPLQVIACIWGVYVVNSWICLFRNYLTARKVGLPLRVIPVSPENPLWMLVDKKILMPLFAYFPITFPPSVSAW